MSISHSFSVALAQQVGLREAILLTHFGYWHNQNRANNRHYHDSHYWTYNTVKAFNEQYPYLTPKEIWGVLERMEKDGWIKTGNYNEKKMDRTKWYALTEKGCLLLSIPFSPQVKCKFPKSKMDFTLWEIPFYPTVKAIPLLTITKPLTFSIRKKADVKKRKAVKPATPELIFPPFAGEAFRNAWATLIRLPKWKGKDAESLQKSLNKLARYDEAFCVGLMDDSIEGNWQGVVFDTSKNGPTTNERWQQHVADLGKIKPLRPAQAPPSQTYEDLLKPEYKNPAAHEPKFRVMS